MFNEKNDKLLMNVKTTLSDLWFIVCTYDETVMYIYSHAH